ncbi:MAG: TetR/AcrR family transcriptional regulator [Deltaproteobacteria bacterium]|nr:TetR/AcrR family transcriptional regulator [Deltaproteobacteria bacterium]
MPRPKKTDGVDPSKTRKETLRTAAYRLFRDRGYESTSVEAICDSVGVSKGAFYWHYPSKHDVFVDILEVWTQQVIEQMFAQFQAALRSPDYVAQTTQALDRELRRGRAMVPLWLDFSLRARRDAGLQSALGRFYQRARGAVGDMLRPVLHDRVDEVGLQGLAAAVFGGYMGLLVQEMADPEGADAGRAVVGFMRVFERVGLVG